MADLFITLASIAPAASKVGGKDAERIPGISPSMKDGVLAERSVASTPTPLSVIADAGAISIWRFDESSGVTATNSGGAPESPGGIPHISTQAELTQYYPAPNVLTGGFSISYGAYVYDPWYPGGRWGRLAGPSDTAALYIVPVLPPPTSFPQPPWSTGFGQPLHIVPGPGIPSPWLDDFWLTPGPSFNRMVVPASEPPFYSTYGVSWAGGGMGVGFTGFDPGGAVPSWYAEGSAAGPHSLGTPTSYTTPAPPLNAGATNPTIAQGKLSNGRFFNGTNMWMDGTPTQYLRDQLRGDMTVEGWIYLDPAWASATATYQLGILSLQTTSAGPHTTTQPQFVIELCRVAPPSDPGQTVQAMSFWWLGDTGTLHKKTDVPTTVPTGVWTHFAWRRRLRGGNWELSYFQNGAHIVTSTGTGDVVAGNTNKFRLGAIADTGTPTDNFFKGGLDDIRLSGVARSDQEILQTYRRGV